MFLIQNLTNIAEAALAAASSLSERACSRSRSSGEIVVPAGDEALEDEADGAPLVDPAFVESDKVTELFPVL